MEADLTFAELYRDLVAATREGLTPPPESFGAQEFAKDSGLHPRTALDLLKRKQEVGELCGGKFAIDGNKTWRFWFPGADDDE